MKRSFGSRAFVVIICAPLALGSAVRAGFGQEGLSPYADETDREIKALAPEEVSGLLDGTGLGFGRAAELNGVPGPRHVLEFASDLALSDEQRSLVQAAYDRMHAKAVELGARVVELERQLDRAFANSGLTAEEVERLTLEIGDATGRLRATHLTAHLETANVLTPEQIARYGHLRGYAEHADHGSGHQHPDDPR